MTEARTSRYSPMRLAYDRASTASGRGRRDRRLGARLWSLLHAQALLAGHGGPGDVALIEDDRRRLAHRQAR